VANLPDAGQYLQTQGIGNVYSFTGQNAQMQDMRMSASNPQDGTQMQIGTSSEAEGGAGSGRNRTDFAQGNETLSGNKQTPFTNGDGEGIIDKKGTAPAKEGKRSGGATKIIHKDGRVEIIGEGEITKIIDKRPYLNPKNRPSHRKRLHLDVWFTAESEGGGVVDDPNTHDVIHWKPKQPRKGVWDLGHKPNAKYSVYHQYYLDGDLTPAEFRDWYNNPENYRPELPGSNRGHKYE